MWNRSPELISAATLLPVELAVTVADTTVIDINKSIGSETNKRDLIRRAYLFEMIR